jgi:hypothetical protein
MVGINSQYVLRFSLGDKNDFIANQNLISYTIVEQVGNMLPNFELIFTSHDDEILSYINEGNTLKIAMGVDEDNLIDNDLVITRVNIGKTGDGRRRILLIGVSDNLEYLNNTKMQITDLKSGVEVVSDVVSNHFKTDFNILSSSDSQYWIQPNVPDREFVNKVALHSYLPNSFIATAITADGTFRLYGMKRAMKAGFNWRFSQESEKEYDIPYSGYFPIDISTGIINNIAGYGRDRLVNELEEGTSAIQFEETDPIMSQSTLNRNTSIDRRATEDRFTNDNVHDNYWKAADRNRQHLLVFSSVRTTVTFVNFFKPIKPLDIAMYVDEGIGLETKDIAEHQSGYYVVSKVARNIVGETMSTVVELLRESFNTNIGGIA